MHGTLCWWSDTLRLGAVLHTCNTPLNFLVLVASSFLRVPDYSGLFTKAFQLFAWESNQETLTWQLHWDKNNWARQGTLLMHMPSFIRSIKKVSFWHCWGRSSSCLLWYSVPLGLLWAQAAQVDIYAFGMYSSLQLLSRLPALLQVPVIVTHNRTGNSPMWQSLV